LARWQAEERVEMRKRLKESGAAIDTTKLFIEDAEADDSEVNDGAAKVAVVSGTSK